MIDKISMKTIEVDEKAFRYAVINKINQIVDAVNVGVVWDIKVDTDMTNGRVNAIDETQRISFETLANGGQIDEQTVLEHKDTISEWRYVDDEKKPVEYKFDQYVRHLDKLYKVIQKHTAQADWTPDITPTLYTVIDATHAGTLEDPIPAVVNMEYVKGLYYIEDGVIYLMNREGMADGESITLAFLPSQLVGHYFEIVDVE